MKTRKSSRDPRVGRQDLVDNCQRIVDETCGPTFAEAFRRDQRRPLVRLRQWWCVFRALRWWHKLLLLFGRQGERMEKLCMKAYDNGERGTLQDAIDEARRRTGKQAVEREAGE